MTEQLQELASLYVLGALSADERKQFEARLRDEADVRELVLSLQRASNLMVLAAPQTPLPTALKQKVMDRVSARSKEQRLPGFKFIGAQDLGGWKELPVRGAWVKLLSLEREKGYAVLMGKLEAGVKYPAHTHEGAEEIYMLTGDLHIGDRTLKPGDFHHADAGTSHGVNYSVEGCTLLAVLPADHEIVQFAISG